MRLIRGETWLIEHNQVPTTSPSGAPATLHTMVWRYNGHTVRVEGYSERDCKADMARELRKLLVAAKYGTKAMES